MGLMQFLVLTVTVILLLVGVIGTLYSKYQIENASTQVKSGIDRINQHRLEILGLENAVLNMGHGSETTTTESSELQTRLNFTNWLATIQLIDQPIANTLSLPQFLTQGLPATAQTDTRKIKLLLNEISLALSQLQSTAASPVSINQDITREALSAAKDYKKHIQPLLDKQNGELAGVSETLAQYQFRSTLILIGLLAALSAVFAFLIVKLKHQAKLIKLQSQLMLSSLHQLKGGLLIVDEQLHIELAELDHFNINVPEFAVENSPFDSLFYDHLTSSELTQWKISLEQLLVDALDRRDYTGSVSRPLDLRSNGQLFKLHAQASLIKINDKVKLLVTLGTSHFELLKAPAFEEMSKDKDIEADKASHGDEDQSSPSTGTNQHIRLKKDFSRRLKLIETLTQMDQVIAADFFKDTKKALQTCQMRLSALEKGQHNPSTMLSGLLQVLHQVKGDAAILGLVELSQSIHHLEDQLNELPHPPSSSPKKLTQASERFEQIKRQFDGLYRLFSRFSKKDHLLEDSEQQSFTTYLAQYAQKVARDAGKRIKLVEDNLEGIHIPDGKQSQVMTILSQLVRNSIAHGLEDSATRTSLHKTDYGCIHISAQQYDDELVIRVRDDGRGIEIPKVIARAKVLGNYDTVKHQKINSQNLFELLATPGLSTKTKANEHAGRGLGLELVKNIVKDLNGTVKLDTKPGQFAEFIVSIPTQANQQIDPDDIPTLVLETEEAAPA